MDQRAGEKKEEEERKSEDSSDHRRKDDADAAAEGGNHGESMDPHQRDGGYDYEEAEEITAGVFIKEVEVEVVVVGGSEEEASPRSPLLAHPCALLQLLLRACAGCLSLHGCCSDDDEDPKPAAAADDDVPAAAADTDSPQEEDRQGGGGGDKVASEVVTEVWAVRRRPAPPGRPREGPGGDGGNHN